MQGTPQTMQDNPHYNCGKRSVELFFKQSEITTTKGLSKIIRPCFRFGKTVEHNYQLLNKLEELHIELPLLVGVSSEVNGV